ncbi:MAG: diaminopimelate epimerase [Rhodospirillaceae bacterium]|jgi:diaminopimelate epimerase|nr:diaminopimelate epimerase [Rhodospirillaceae bacterium]
MTAVPFRKMHGLGNDFVVLDARDRAIPLSIAHRRWIADRRRGIGCDQLIVLEPPQDKLADVFMRIYNPDGSEAGACGNATRCIAATVMAENGKRHAIVETVSGLLDTEAVAGGLVSVDMGVARLDWREIPVGEACDTLHLPLALGPLQDPVGVNVGNPHAVFFVADAERIDLAALGPVLERHRLFPERANIEVAQIIASGPDTIGRIRMRVWERGAGITQACGSGACATLVAAARRKLTGRSATVVLDGGELLIEWLADNHVRMTGGWSESFRGEMDIDEMERQVA